MISKLNLNQKITKKQIYSNPYIGTRVYANQLLIIDENYLLPKTNGNIGYINHAKLNIKVKKEIKVENKIEELK
mgnify:CR=1 FL=1|jgi:hypothetical protein